MIVLLGALLGPTPVKAYTSCQTGYTLSGNDCTLSRMRDTDSSGTCSSTTFNQPAWTGNCRAVPYGYRKTSGLNFVEDPPANPTSCLASQEKSAIATLATVAPTGQYFCYNCPAGYTCDGTTATKVPDGKMTNSGGGATSATGCPAGSYCPSINKLSDEAVCPTGFYSAADQVRCTQCPKGSRCSTTAATACSSGQYSVAGQTSCKTCPAGFFCASTTALPQICAKGFYSSSGATSCTPCTAGYKCTVRAQTGCPAGTYSAAQSTTCTKCPAGSKCPALSASPTACASGEYSLPGASTCTSQTVQGAQPGALTGFILNALGQICTNGLYYDSATRLCKQCDLGKHCSQYSLNNPVNAVAGSCSGTQYCPKGTLTSDIVTCPAYLKCSDHTYTICNDGKMLSGVSSGSCIDCPAGNYCTLRADNLKQAVSAGYYSLVGVSVQLICPGGKLCSQTAAPTNCADGTYYVEGSTFGCTTCPSGYACPSTEMPLASQIDCSKVRGYYYDTTAYPSGGATKCTPCPAGWYCPYNSGAQKYQCPVGSFSLTASESCTMCPKGYACPNRDKPDMKLCMIGTYSDAGQATCSTCPAGSECIGAQQPVACDKYRYSLSGQGQCQFFPVGNYATTSTTAGTACATGTYSMYGDAATDIGINTCKACPKGHYCPTPSKPPKKCLPGTYMDVTNWSTAACKSCPSGSYSLFGAWECYECPYGHYCSSADKVPRKCPPGSYAQRGQTQCTRCSDGKYCAPGISTQASPTAKCPKGLYCTVSGSHPNFVYTETPCPVGSYNSLEGQSTLGNCQSCSAGYYCPFGATEKYICPPGHYCAGTATSKPTPCPVNKYNNLYQQTSSAACLSCPSGYQCLEGSTLPQTCPTGQVCTGTGAAAACTAGQYSGSQPLTSALQCKNCWPGYYCPLNAVFPTPCPKGTYNNLSSKSALSDCLNCPAGTPCPFLGLQHSDTGLYCAPGHYCPAGTTHPTQNPCTLGYTSSSISYTQLSDCTATANKCPAGFYCTAGSNPFTNPPIICPAGYYCPLGSGTFTLKCPAGSYSNEVGLSSDTQCLVCPAGYICAAGQSTYTTTSCPVGNYCTQGELSATGQNCPAGYMTSVTNAISASQCTPCPMGYYCTNNAQNVMTQYPCPAGTYSNRLHVVAAADGGSRGCKTCPAGYICNTSPVTIDPVACQPGTYQSLTGQTACVACGIGNYCDRVAMTAAIPCGNGYNCNNANIAYRPETQDATYGCPPGYYCTGSSKTACLAGTYQPFWGKSLITDCITTPAGYYTNQPASTSYILNVCAVGMYCGAGTTSATASSNIADTNMHMCPVGKFRSLTKGTQLSDCADCPAGYICGQATSNPTICPLGFYCVTGSSAASGCPSGTFGTGQGLTQLSDCTNCFGGRYCLAVGQGDVTGKCDPGYYCVSNSNTGVPQYANVGNAPPDSFGRVFPVGNICEAGGYCPQGSKFPLPCQPGYFNSLKQKTLITDCQACTAGMYCDGTPDLTRTDLPAISGNALATMIPRATVTGPCQAGYYCTGGAYNPRQNAARVGKYSGSGATIDIDCGTGSFQANKGQASCTTCPAGYYCPSTAMTAPTKCPAGKYCQGTGRSSTQDCPTGTFSSKEQLTMVSLCDDCTSGNYCGTTGLTAVTGTCNAGYYCNKKAITNTPTSGTWDQFGQCPHYHWCAAAVGMGQPCKPGTNAGANLGLTASTSCGTKPSGSYSRFVTQFTGSGNPTQESGQCKAGWFCPAGSKWDSDYTSYCKLGEKCPAGSSVAIKCVAGEWQPNDIQDKCFVCPAGYFCDTTAATTLYDLSTKKCPKGYYCPAGSTSGTTNPCPSGYYNENFGGQSETTACVPAPPGYFIPSTGATTLNVANVCQAGYYCKIGSNTATPNGSNNGLMTVPITDIGGQCQVGFYCPVGAPQQIKCTPGKMCTTAGLSLPNQDCPAGSYCLQGRGTTVSGVCPAGYYCPLKSAAAIPCPAGTYNTQTGRTAISDCVDCTQGYYCPNVAQNSVDTTNHRCSAGFYCPTGSKHSKVNLCTVGNKCPTQSHVQTACSDVSQGEYQDETGASVCKQCQPGWTCTQTTTSRCQPQLAGPSYYCTGMTTRSSTACPAGKYTYQDGASSLSDCLTCPAGYFCPQITDGSISNTMKIQVCPAGQYCLSGVAAGTTCPVGFYCPAGTNAPIPCPIGYACTTTGLSAYDQTCTAGNYCAFTTDGTIPSNRAVNGISPAPKGAISPGGTTCTAGHYCAAGSQKPYPCPIGTYNPNTGSTSSSACLKCPAGRYCISPGLTTPGPNCDAGYFCPEGSSNVNAQPCPAGSKCPAASAAAQLCTAGFYQPNAVQADCKQCPIGMICETTGLLLPNICPQGQYCATLQLSAGVDCPQGTWSSYTGLTDVSQCQACQYGKYCVGTGLISYNQGTQCDPLYYCTVPNSANIVGALLGTTQRVACSAGQICPSGTILPGKCAPGTYSTSTVATTTSSCVSCPANTYCPAWGLVTASLQTCPDGYLCLGGAVHPANLDNVTVKLCPAGSFCAQSNCATPGSGCNPQKPCAINTYNPREGQSVCLACEPGYDCSTGTGIVTPSPCGRGYYCPGGVAPIPCPAGTYSSIQYLKEVTQCNPCPPGTYCLIGSQSFTAYCNAGYVCTGGQSSPTPIGTFDTLDYAAAKSGQCPLGHYCPYGSSYPVPCPAGTYQNKLGQSTCINCDKYKFCPTSGLTAVGPACHDGYVCFGSAIFAQPFDYITGRMCNTGHYCTGGQEIQCPGGTYSPIPGLATCLTCPPGYYCNDAVGTIQPKICPTYKYCPIGTQFPVSCPNGTYTNPTQTGLEDQSQCAACPAGYYCVNGTYNLQNQCSAGYYCDAGAYNQTQANKTCPGGYYCLQGTQVPTPCPQGEFSLPGAKNVNQCGPCLAGYYCVRYVSSAIMVTCPVGFYCPKGLDEPIACPIGTYNDQKGSKNVTDCKTCPQGTACDQEGIANYNNFLCPPGHFCPVGTTQPQSCPLGSFRPTSGAYQTKSVPYSQNNYVPACFLCPPGYFCQQRAQVVPEVCPVGKYCPEGNIVPTDCTPGHYCPINSGDQIKCPKGYYCPSSSDKYIKCPFGTYCEAGSAAPTPCPDGTYGSGTLDNFNEKMGCKDCGRGLYSTKEVPDVCLDCTPGYVCYGRTNSKFPALKAKNNGEPCPQGYYCPGATYNPIACPIGTYAKQTGTKSKDTCLKCPNGFYNDVPGAAGCKSCGPTSKSFGGATSCVCNGKNRDFIKTGGQCLCSTGYKPKDGAPNVDSNIDCELISKAACPANQDVDILGNCVNSTQASDICTKQCAGQPGKLVQGTGICQCASINDPSQVCDRICQKTSPQSSLNSRGQLSVFDPVTNKTQTVDPSTIPGYYGDFACQSKAGDGKCKVVYMGMTKNGEFTFDYQTPPSVISATQVPVNTNKKNLMAKLKRKLEYGQPLRYLQSVDQAEKLYNPVICTQVGGTIFFEVDVTTLNYPVYFKDSIINTNPNFDYGPFQNLEYMITQQNVNVTVFSFIFKDIGTYVFKSYNASQLVVISIVDQSQTCSNSINGIGAAMITQESLSAVGVKSLDKDIKPDWWFISFSFISLNVFVFILIGLLIRAHNLKVKGQTNIFKDNEIKSSIYYDKLVELDRQDQRGLCCKRKKVDQKPETLETQPEVKHEYAIQYKDLEALLDQFNQAQKVLNKQLQDREKREQQFNKKFDEDGNLVVPLSQEDELISEMVDLLDFTRRNRATIDKALKPSDKKKDQMSNQSLAQEFQNQLVQNITTQLKSMLEQNVKAEDLYQARMQDKIKEKQKQMVEANFKSNENMQNLVQQEFKNRLGQNSEFNADAILQEIQAKTANINELMEKENDEQLNTFQDQLAKRKAKKEKLQNLLSNLQEQKLNEDQGFQKNVDEIHQLTLTQTQAVDQEIEDLRKQELAQISQANKEKRQKLLSDSEQRLADFRRKTVGNPEADLQFNDMLKEYGEKVKRVDTDLAVELEQQRGLLDDRLKRRKQERIRELQDLAKSREQEMTSNNFDKKKLLNNEILQVQSLLKPIVNETEKLAVILQHQKIENGLRQQDSNNVTSQLNAIDKQSQEQLSKIDNAQVQKLQKQIEADNEIKRKQIEMNRERIKNSIDSALDNDERQRLMQQLEDFERNLASQLTLEAEQQNRNLRDAIEQRRNRRRNVLGDTVDKKQKLIVDQYSKNCNQGVNQNVNQNLARELADRIHNAFGNNEAVQVAENFIEQKQQQELMDLMQNLFEQRAETLRKLIIELALEKQKELNGLKDEMEPQKEFLRQKKIKGLITAEDFQYALDKLTSEETERAQDIEIAFNDKEKDIKEELEQINLEAEAEQKKLLKDRHTQEKVMVFQQLMKKLDDGDLMKSYVEKQLKEFDKELDQFKKKADKDKEKKKKEFELLKQEKMQELKERQQRMYSWEEQQKRDENQHMEQFRRQKEEIMARKLAEQQRELLKDMNQQDVDNILSKHKREMDAVENVLQEEQQKQLERMKERMKGRNAGKNKDAVLRQIKLAEIKKTQQEQLEKAKQYQKSHEDENAATNELLQRCVDKAGLMQKLCQKQCYSRKIYFKRHIQNQQKLNLFLGRGILADWESSKGGIDDVSDMSDLSINTQQLKEAVNQEDKITYKTLLEHIENADKTYEQMRPKRENHRGSNMSQRF